MIFTTGRIQRFLSWAFPGREPELKWMKSLHFTSVWWEISTWWKTWTLPTFRSSPEEPERVPNGGRQDFQEQLKTIREAQQSENRQGSWDKSVWNRGRINFKLKQVNTAAVKDLVRSAGGFGGCRQLVHAGIKALLWLLLVPVPWWVFTLVPQSVSLAAISLLISSDRGTVSKQDLLKFTDCQNKSWCLKFGDRRAFLVPPCCSLVTVWVAQMCRRDSEAGWSICRGGYLAAFAGFVIISNCEEF